MLEIGDLVRVRHMSQHAMGVVTGVDLGDRYVKPRAKILMFNGRIYQFMIDDLELKSKGDNHESV